MCPIIADGLQSKGAFPRPASLWLDGDEVVVWFDPVTRVVTSITTLIPDQWYHVAGTYDGSEARVYIDGGLDATGDESAVPLTNTSPLFFGQHGGRFNLLGTFDTLGGVVIVELTADGDGLVIADTVRFVQIEE